MDIFDTHFHLLEDDDIEAIHGEANSAGVTRLMLAGAPVNRMEPTLNRIKAYPYIYAAAGVHPHDAHNFDGNISRYEDFLKQTQVVSVGEVGLDYHYMNSDKSTQTKVFSDFLDLANQWKYPVVVHCRDAFEDCYALLERHLAGRSRFVIHCFTGTEEWARRFLDLNGYISFNGIMTFRRSDDIRKVLQKVPIERVLFETDSPYLAPVPHRGKKNRPAYMPYIVNRAAEVLDMPPEELIRVSTANALSFFGITDTTCTSAAETSSVE